MKNLKGRYFSFFLFDIDGKSIAEAAKIINVSYSHTQRLIKDLAADGFIMKKISPDNLREKTIALTKKGVQMKKLIRR